MTVIRESMTSTEFFCEALDRYIQFPSREAVQELSRACGAVWNYRSEVPINARSDIGELIPNFIEFRQWETNGRTYAGAAQRILPALKQEYDLHRMLDR